MTKIATRWTRAMVAAVMGVAMMAGALPASAQPIDSDLAGPAATTPPASESVSDWADPYPDPEGKTVPAATPPAAPPAAPVAVPSANGTPMDSAAPAAADASAAASEAASNPGGAAGAATTYKQDDLIGAAEGVFGKGAEGLARMIQTWLDKQGEPNAYIVGREGGGAIVFGLRYGSGTMYHKVEGEKPVYWTGPSVGFDVGANAGNTFVLVYNLHDTEDLYKRFPAGEGQAYVVGGLTASYLRRGDVVIIPIRMGAGLRLGINAGYMKFSKKAKWIPF